MSALTGHEVGTMIAHLMGAIETPDDLTGEDIDDLLHRANGVLDRLSGVGEDGPGTIVIEFDGSEGPSPEPKSWAELAVGGIDVLLRVVGFVYLMQQAANFGTWLGVTYG